MNQLRFNIRALLAFSHDAVASALAWLFAYWLRFNLEVPEPFLTGLWKTLAWVVPLQAIIFWRFGLYRGIWRYASLPDLKRILAAVAVAAMAVALVLVMFQIRSIVPRSILLLDPILLVVLMGGSRLAYRVWKEHKLYGVVQQQGEPVLVLGAGDAAVNLVKELDRSREWRIVGLLDDRPGTQGRFLHGVRVLGKIEDLGHWAAQTGVKRAIIAMPSASHQARRRALEICNAAGIGAMTVPSFDDLMSGKVTVSQIRNVELDDLLSRDPVVLDSAGLRGSLAGQVVLVTGAGGSIGSELCRQIARFEPRRLVLFELCEYALYLVQQEFASRFPEIPTVCVVGDVKDGTRVEQVMKRYTPSVVFHAAAYKHVPLMELENAWQAVCNNAGGAYVLASAAIRHGIRKFVLISTDKAVNPTNVMGASKRLAEMVCQGLQPQADTRFVMVRFGNVLGSTGSVIPKFREQIAQGGPVTITHPDITRYFMSIPEAAQLVLQAGLMGEGGEIFVMEMGEPVKIADLARDMIRLSGFTEDEIKIVYTGLRPGEKLYEELLADGEHTLSTPHPKLRIAKARQVDQRWLEALLLWLDRNRALGDEKVKEGLTRWVPEYMRTERPTAQQAIPSEGQPAVVIPISAMTRTPSMANSWGSPS